MQWFYNLRIAIKLALAFGFLLLLTMGLSINDIRAMGEMRRTSSELVEDWMPSMLAAMTLRGDVADLRRWELAHLVNPDPAIKKVYEKKMDETLAAIQVDIQDSAKVFLSDREKVLFDQFKTSWAQLLLDHNQLVELSRKQQMDEGRALASGHSAEILAQIGKHLAELVKINVDGSKEAGALTVSLVEHARTVSIALLVVGLLLGTVLAISLAQIVSRPLKLAVAAARKVAQGDLGGDIAVLSRCEIGQLMEALGEMTASLRHLVGQVREGTETIAAASGQIASGNLELSSRTEQQASSLEETASSMEELTSAVAQNAQHALQADQLAGEASVIAKQSGHIVQEVVSTMAGISASSKRIVDIIGVIDGIAFQTNILALNAAVEAARAGEQGRGFAVVASEVRNLAQRSATAAKDIKALIGASVEQVGAGAKLAEQAGLSMEQVVTSIVRVSGLMSDIAVASREQSQGIDQVNQAVVGMEQSTQQNAALVEEATASAAALNQQAAVLSDLVSAFTLSATGSAGTPHYSEPKVPSRAMALSH